MALRGQKSANPVQTSEWVIYPHLMKDRARIIKMCPRPLLESASEVGNNEGVDDSERARRHE